MFSFEQAASKAGHVKRHRGPDWSLSCVGLGETKSPRRHTEVEGESAVCAALSGLTVSCRAERGDSDVIRSRLCQLGEELTSTLIHAGRLSGVPCP